MNRWSSERIELLHEHLRFGYWEKLFGFHDQSRFRHRTFPRRLHLLVLLSAISCVLIYGSDVPPRRSPHSAVGVFLKRSDISEESKRKLLIDNTAFTASKI